MNVPHNYAVKLTSQPGHAPCFLGSAPHLPASRRAQGARPFRPAAYRERSTDKSKTMRCLIMLAIALGFSWVLAPSKVYPFSQAPDPGLKGIQSVCVFVETQGDVPLDFREFDLQDELQSRLLASGVPVASGTECHKVQNHGYAFFWIDATRSGTGRLYVYIVEFEFSQDVVLARDRATTVFAPTWTNRRLGIVASENLTAAARAHALELADLFGGLFLDEQQQVKPSRPSNKRVNPAAGRGIVP